jgi:hypothetical protein
MPDAGLLTSLGVPGFSIWVLWMAYKIFVARLAAKDAEHATERAQMHEQMAREREEFLKRIDARDEAFRKLESDIRNNFAATLVESGNLIKEAVIRAAKREARKK